MSDLRTLHDAFAELERRADAAASTTAPVARPRRTVRPAPVAATVAAVAVLVAGSVWLAPGDSGTHVADPQTTSSSPAPTTSAARSPVPTSPDDLITRFRAVLGGTATFEVTMKTIVPRTAPSQHQQPEMSVVTPEPGDPNNSALVGGTLMSAGSTGGFALMIRRTDSGPDEWCAFSRTDDCDVSTLPDGSVLATGTGRPDAGAVSYMAALRRPDGTLVVLNVSNQEDPLGAVVNSPGGAIHSPQPPLSLDQLKAIVTSDKW
ncbi:hypothetical protein ACWEFJ_03655 [Actinosynnema sp. NPDC004786]